MRGKDLYYYTKTRLRITPAYAGKSRPIPMSICVRRITPAYAGEKSVYTITDYSNRITPAYAGKRSWNNDRSPRPGITPAYAGKSYHAKFSERNGITPAYAGKSLPLWTGRKACKDHPRLCGKSRKEWEDWMNGRITPPMRGKVLVKSRV